MHTVQYYNIAKAFVYFVRSGSINISNGRLKDANIAGYNWPRTAATYTNNMSATAYYFDFNATGVYPSANPYPRWVAFPLRCLAD